ADARGEGYIGADRGWIERTGQRGGARGCLHDLRQWRSARARIDGIATIVRHHGVTANSETTGTAACGTTVASTSESDGTAAAERRTIGSETHAATRASAADAGGEGYAAADLSGIERTRKRGRRRG